MTSNCPQSSLEEIFQETERFLKEFDRSASIPPFITTVFGDLRSKAFQKVQNDILNDKKNMLMFISKFEVEYMDVLRSKLLNCYKEFIMIRNHQVSAAISIKEMEKFGTATQLRHFAMIVAELTIELEINSYTIEGLLLYGLIERGGEKPRNYLKKLITEYAYKKKDNSKKSVEPLFRRMIESISPKDASMNFDKEISRTGIKEKDLIDFVLNVSNGNKNSWQSLTSTVNFTWSAGKCLCNYFLQRLKDFTLKKEMMTKLSDLQETFVSNRIQLMTERKSMLGLVERILESEGYIGSKKGLDKLVWAAEKIFDPQNKNNRKRFHDDIKAECDTFIIQEEEDVVVIDEKKREAYADETVVIVE